MLRRRNPAPVLTWDLGPGPARWWVRTPQDGATPVVLTVIVGLRVHPPSGREVSAVVVLPFQKLTFPEMPLYLGEWGHLDPAEENLKTFRKLLLWGETCPPQPNAVPVLFQEDWPRGFRLPHGALVTAPQCFLFCFF